MRRGRRSGTRLAAARGIMAERERRQDDTIGGLVRGILTDVRALIRDEIALARLELRDQARRARAGLMSLVIAASALLMSGVFLLIATATGLASVLDWPVWVGFLVVALVLGAAAGLAFAVARRQLNALRAVPPQTAATFKENVEWIAKRLSSAPK